MSVFNEEPILKRKIQKTLGEADKKEFGRGRDGVSVVARSRSFSKKEDTSILKYLNRTPRCGSTSRLPRDGSTDDKLGPIAREEKSRDNLVESNSNSSDRPSADGFQCGQKLEKSKMIPSTEQAVIKKK